MTQPEEHNGQLSQDAASFGKMPHAAAAYGTVPQSAADFRSVRQGAERSEHHTLTVKEVARMFEEAGVPRIERSIINWCQPNRQGIARLDAFYDTNERKYFITAQSVELAIREEQAKQAVGGKTASVSDAAESLRQRAESRSAPSEDAEEIDTLRNKMRDLEITNRVKDQVIGMMEKERDRLMGERENYVYELMSQSHRIGQLETEVRQLAASKSVASLESGSDTKLT